MFQTVFRLLVLAVSLAALPCRAHLPLESTLVLTVGAEREIEVEMILSESAARGLLTPPPATILNPEVFEQHRARLLETAGEVCALLDAGDHALAPERVLVSLNPEGEVCYLFIYPAGTTATRLRCRYLETAAPGSFVLAKEGAATAPRHAVLVRGRSGLNLAAFAAIPLPPPAANPAATPAALTAVASGSADPTR